MQAFLQECPYLLDYGERLQARFLPTPEPRHATLTLAYDMIWKSEWLELRREVEVLPAEAEATDAG